MNLNLVTRVYPENYRVQDMNSPGILKVYCTFIGEILDLFRFEWLQNAESPLYTKFSCCQG